MPYSNGKDNTSLILAPSRDIELARFMPIMAIDQALERRNAIVDATKKLMREGTDFGKVPGTDRDVLLQPGADKLCNLFGLVIKYETVKCVEDWCGERHGGVPFFFYEIKGRAFRGDFLMGEGSGSCSSWESKYKYRNAERICPQCGKAAILKSKDQGGGWFCWRRKDGCGANFAPGDPRIEGQEVGRKINPDMADVVNTVLKMAQKRAKVSATINATSASEFFTQDVEDQEEPDSDPRGWKVDIGDNRYGTREAQQYVAEQKLAELKRKPKAAEFPLPDELTTSKSGEIKAAFSQLRQLMGETSYFAEMEMAGAKHSIFDLRELAKIKALYSRMVLRAKQEREVA